MGFYRMIWAEMFRRPGQSITALLVVALGVSALVAVDSVATSSERKIAMQMQQLGANVLILPAGVSLQDYYAADAHGQSLPEEYVSRITMAQLVGVEELSPKLTLNCDFRDTQVVLTGVLPRTEFYKQSAWQSVDLLTADLNDLGIGKQHSGCSGRTCQLSTSERVDLSSYATTRIIHELSQDAVLVGADAARDYGIQSGDRITVQGASFRVAGVLPTTGTTDDARIFAHLHRVQELSGSGAVVNVIEVMGCCEEAATDLVSELDALLPNARVVTISQIVEAQVTVNQIMNRLSLVLFGILMLIGGFSIASSMFANVTERRRELGTLMALGATPGMVSRMILVKALAIGVLGGTCGVLLGVGAARLLGPHVLELPISISAQSIFLGSVVATAVALAASFFPARRAAHLDPCLSLREM